MGGFLSLFVLLSISSSWVYLRLHTKTQLSIMPGSASKVCVGGGGWVLKVNLVIDFGYSLALAKLNNIIESRP